jgi:acyl-CoA synthetase (AMP-forming)/AMP-acid ligase II
VDNPDKRLATLPLMDEAEKQKLLVDWNNTAYPREQSIHELFELIAKSTFTSEQAGDSVSIGKPVANTRVYVLDQTMQPVPVGVAGELYFAGDRVTRAYLDSPSLTAEWFVPDPFNEDPGGRLFRSGELARYRSSGDLEFLGRIDRRAQVARIGMAKVFDEDFVAPRNDCEERLCALWEELLPVERVGVHDNFFMLGGHSLLAMHVLTRVREEFKREVPVRRFLENPTIATIAEVVQEEQVQEIMSAIPRASRAQTRVKLSTLAQRATSSATQN